MKTTEQPTWTYRYEQEKAKATLPVGPVPEEEEKDKEKDRTNTWLTNFTPITVDGKTSTSAIIWFTPTSESKTTADHLFGLGTHHLVLSLFNETSSTPIAIKQFGTRLKDTDVDHLKSKSMSELPVTVIYY
jgi:hypothetical protein